MKGVSLEKELAIHQRTEHVMRRYGELMREKHNCVTCVEDGNPRKCGKPHAFPQKSIATELGLPHQSIAQDIARCRRNWRRNFLHPEVFEAEKQKSLDGIEYIQREARESWERSKNPSTRKTRETSQGGTPPVTHLKALEVTEDSNGDPRYLDIWIRADARKASLLGLDAPKKIAPTTPSGEGLFDWMAGFAKHALTNVVDITPRAINALPEPTVDDVAEILEWLEDETHA